MRTKRCELEKEIGLGIFALSASIVDKAEPSEALKANTVWSLGVENPTYLISSLQLDALEKEKKFLKKMMSRQKKVLILLVQNLNIAPNQKKNGC